MQVPEVRRFTTRFAPDGGGGVRTGTETCGETTSPAVLYRSTGNWAGLSGATKSLIIAGKELNCHGKKGVKVNRFLSGPLLHYPAVRRTLTYKITNTIQAYKEGYAT